MPGVPAVAWLAFAFGFGVMFVPTYWAAAGGTWTTDEHGHGPLILLISAWLLWHVRDRVTATPAAPAYLVGTVTLGLGLLSYLLGRLLTITSLEFASQVLVLAGGALLLGGWTCLRAMWFPVAYLVFSIPLPATVVDSLTGPLKHWISVVVVDALHDLGYPVARTGVVISVGQFQLLVADACSGLNSIVSLAALGTLYMYVVRRRGPLHNSLLALSILPIAVAANVARVTVLVLITFHFGDEAGQGFLHGAAGILLMLFALAALAAVDWVSVKLVGRRS